MLGFLFKGKKKVAMRTQIVESFIDNLMKCESGQHIDESGSTWSKKSFDEVLDHFDKKVPDLEIETAKKDMHKWAVDLKNPSICDTYNVIHNIYFGQGATEFEKDKLRFEFKKGLEAKGLVGLKKTYDKHFEN